VEVTNTPPESTCYQWYFSGTNALGGATNLDIDVTNVQPVQAGAYTVVVTNPLGAVTSAPALLSVIPPVETTIVPAVGLPGGNGSLLHLEYADSLAAAPAWSSFTNVTLGSGPQLCFDLSQPLPAQRFYRAWQTTGLQPTLNLSLATEIPLTGAIGSSVQIDYINQFGPTNAWMTLDTVTLTNSPQLYFDVTAFRQAPRLYRLVASAQGTFRNLDFEQVQVPMSPWGYGISVADVLPGWTVYYGGVGPWGYVWVEACTNPANPTWHPLATNTPASQSFYFSDSQWTNYPARFYRFRSQ
jgi:hypothetical protein